MAWKFARSARRGLHDLRGRAAGDPSRGGQKKTGRPVVGRPVRVWI